MRLRDARPEDVDAATRVVFASLRAYGIEPDPDGLDADLREFGLARKGVAETVAEIDGAIVGLVALTEQEGRGWVGKLFVDATHRGHGIGKALLARAVEQGRARGLKRLELQTRTIFREAVLLYEKTGWTRGPDREGPGPDRTYFLDL